MPDLTIPMTNAQATRFGAAYRQLTDRDGQTPAENATAAQIWAHGRRVVIDNIIQTIKSMESQASDDELDGMIE